MSLRLYAALCVLVLLGGAFVGVVKFMAWWQIATGGCGNG